MKGNKIAAVFVSLLILAVLALAMMPAMEAHIRGSSRENETLL